MLSSDCVFAQSLQTGPYARRFYAQIVSVGMSAVCVRERFFSHGPSSVRRKTRSQDTKLELSIVIYNLSGDGPPRVDGISGTVNRGRV